MSRQRIAALIAIPVVLALALAGVLIAGGGDKEEPTTTTTTAPTTTTTEKPGPVAPLTGLPVKQSEAADLKRPALVVKIDNSDRDARPQWGLTSADVVFEPRVEGGVTRFMVVFHSHGSNPVGPVRSFRNTDVNILSALNRPLFAWHGANGISIQALNEAKRDGRVVDVGIDAQPSLYYRDHSRAAPHNSMTNTRSLFGVAPAGSKPPHPLFTYRKIGQKATGGTKVGAVGINYGGGPGSAPVEWRWNNHSKCFARYQNGTKHTDTTGKQVCVANVIIQFVEYRDTGQTDVIGDAVPEAISLGKGDAWVLTDGQLILAKWRKDNPLDITTYKSGGKIVKLTPGQTWVNLPPAGAASKLS